MYIFVLAVLLCKECADAAVFCKSCVRLIIVVRLRKERMLTVISVRCNLKIEIGPTSTDIDITYRIIL